MHYLKFLEALHERIEPRVYFEIGIRRGASLTLGKRTVIGVDPSYQIEFPLSSDAHLFRATSDHFFARPDLAGVLGERKVNLAFIDGWHNFEFVLRDFLNIEPHCAPDSIIVFDDVLPRNEQEAVRKPHGGSWTGDVWRIVPCLMKYRPDLQLTLVQTIPTGLLVVERLDPRSTVLRDRYAEIEAEFLDPALPLMPGPEIVERFVPPAAALSAVGSVGRDRR